MKIFIDNNEIETEEGKSVLDAALDAGIFIPHLCSHPDLEAIGGCGLCQVEIEGIEEPVRSCMTKAEEGMKVTIKDPKAEKVRNMAMELILATHPADCTGCPKYGKCELQSMYQYMGVGPDRWKKKSRTVATDESNPLITHLFTRCVRCGRCIRACREVRGTKVLDFQNIDGMIRVGTDGNVSLKEAGCKFCGACIEVCPTGSIMDALGLIKEDQSYAESVIPCKTACPAHTDIPGYLRYVKNGEYDKADALIREKLPLPEILGNVCNHVCEDACKRNELSDPVSICKLKRVAAESYSEEWKKKRIVEDATGKKAAVIGGGPAGLTAAYYLKKKGHEVTIFEANENAGGQCRYGIPSYRLSDEVVAREVANITEIGVELKCNSFIEDPKELLGQGFDTVLVSVGTHQGTKIPIPGNDFDGVLVNADFLKKTRMDQAPEIGERVMVLGGGNVAYDCARTSIRLGAKEVHVACLENDEQMTASLDEREEGKEEGVILHSASSFLSIEGNGKAEGVKLQKVEKFYFDENRKAVIDLVEGSEEIIPVDTVIFAVGQRPYGTEEMGLECVKGCYIQVDENMATSIKGIYSAGDVVTGTKSVIEAVAAGRKAAEEMDKYLGGNGDISETLVERETPDPYIGRTEGFGDLTRVNPDLADVGTRKTNFDTVEKVFSCEQAQCEAGRCLQCDLRLNLEKPKLWNEF